MSASDLFYGGLGFFLCGVGFCLIFCAAILFFTLIHALWEDITESIVLFFISIKEWMNL